MPEPTYIALWIDPAVDQLIKTFRKSFEASGWRIEKSKTLKDGLRRLTYDDPQVDLILVDAQTIRDDDDPKYAILELIRQMDPEIPIVVVTDKPKADLHFAVGRANATVIDKKELSSDPNISVRNLLEPISQRVRRITSYDIEQRKLANLVAENYEAL